VSPFQELLAPGTLSRAERTRLRLLQAGLDVFSRKGPDAASVREIVDVAGQNVAAIAYYFGSKEGLYRAVLEAIVRIIRHQMGAVLASLRQAGQEGKIDPKRATALLQTFSREVYLRLLSREESAPIGRIIMREQTQPSAAFDILYNNLFKEFHEALCGLVGVVLKLDPNDREAIIRTHTLMGQVYFFAMSRETILRRLGWGSLEGNQEEWVADILAEQVRALLDGLRRNKKGRKR